jgi:hypothetical protein
MSATLFNMEKTNADAMRKVNEVRKAEKQQKQAEKEAEKQQKQAEKEAEKHQKQAEKEAEKQQKQAEKEAEKQRKQAEKQKKQEEKEFELLFKKLEKEDNKRKKEATKHQNQLIKDEVKTAIKAERCKQKEKNIKKIQKNKKKFEVQTKTLQNLVPIAKLANQTYPDGFTAKQLTELYIGQYGQISPYTLEEVDKDYDISASIRGIMEETSPSSAQHWFRYGCQKSEEQVAPWLFANKQLAIVNNNFGWKKTTSEMAKARRQNEGKWIYMIEGGNARFDWSIEKYGPLPTEDVLKEAAVGRKKGVRGRKNES